MIVEAVNASSRLAVAAARDREAVLAVYAFVSALNAGIRIALTGVAWRLIAEEKLGATIDHKELGKHCYLMYCWVGYRIVVECTLHELDKDELWSCRLTYERFGVEIAALIVKHGERAWLL
ncbi:MAG: hypothetical protein AAGB51_15085 [Planctomycetota bacterium]